MLEYTQRGFNIDIRPDFTGKNMLLAVRKGNDVVRRMFTKDEVIVFTDNNISLYDEIEKIIVEFEEAAK